MGRQFDGVMVGSIELFCLAAELGGFTAAAATAGLTPAAVSRAIGRLEERLQVRLFARSTRSIRLTEGGRAYHAQCRQALNQLVEAERDLTGLQAEPAGILRISMPTALGHHCVLPLLPKFRERHPKVHVDVHVSNRNIDFVADGFDLAIRGRAQADSGLVARKLLDADVVVVGAPAYFRRAGKPRSPDDLPRHDCVQFVLPSSGVTVPWMFRVAGKDVDVATRGSYTCSEDVLGIASLARAGAGLAQTYRFIVEEDLRTGALVEVLKPFGGRARPFSLLYPGTRHMPLRVRVFVDWLLRAMAERAGS
jgi:DNA-binding transcriptional LysR family regulator